MNRHDTSVQASRQVSPLTRRATSPINPPPPPPPLPRARPLYQRALLYSLPIGAAAVLGTKYGNRVYNTMKELANYGKRLSVNALAAIRGTPYHLHANYTSSNEPTPTPTPKPTPTATPKPTPTAIPKPTPTAIPTATPDPRHPRTGVQLYHRY